MLLLAREYMWFCVDYASYNSNGSTFGSTPSFVKAAEPKV